MSARYVMVIDSTRCMNCKACVVACQQRNQVPYGYSRNWVLENRDEKARGGMSYQPGACMHCDNPVCVAACPTKATYKDDDCSVVVDQERCIGCGGCVKACPYGARFRHPVTGVADKCDYCRESSISGRQPACVSACATGCRSFGDANDPASAVAAKLAAYKQLFVQPADVETRPSLTYLNYTYPEVFPKKPGLGNMPKQLEVMGPLSTGVKILAGLSLFGVIGVFFKQLAWPSDDERHDTPEGQGTNKKPKGPRKNNSVKPGNTPDEGVKA